MDHKCKHLYNITYVSQQIVNKAKIWEYGKYQTYDIRIPPYNTHLEIPQWHCTRFGH